jgi:hypothetical protein
VGWFKPNRSRPAETLQVPVLNFLGEQDGPPERNLKASLCQLFENRVHLQRAYLARVDYGVQGEFNVALCIRMGVSDDAELRKAIGKEFAQNFGKHEHLDIIFVREDQEGDLRNICRPFYPVN